MHKQNLHYHLNIVTDAKEYLGRDPKIFFSFK